MSYETASALADIPEQRMHTADDIDRALQLVQQKPSYEALRYRQEQALRKEHTTTYVSGAIDVSNVRMSRELQNINDLLTGTATTEYRQGGADTSVVKISPTMQEITEDAIYVNFLLQALKTKELGPQLIKDGWSRDKALADLEGFHNSVAELRAHTDPEWVGRRVRVIDSPAHAKRGGKYAAPKPDRVEQIGNITEAAMAVTAKAAKEAAEIWADPENRQKVVASAAAGIVAMAGLTQVTGGGESRPHPVAATNLIDHPSVLSHAAKKRTRQAEHAVFVKPIVKHNIEVLKAKGNHGEVKWGNTATALEFFISRGLTPAQAAGIIGNFHVESGLDPAKRQYQGGPGRGIAQWEKGGRWDALVRYAKAHHLDKYALNTQLEFTWHELTHNRDYALTHLKKAKTAAQAAKSFEKYFEGASIPHMPKRVAYAAHVYSILNQEPLTPTDTIPGPTNEQKPTDPTTELDTHSKEICDQLGIPYLGVQDGYREGKKVPVALCEIGGKPVNVDIAANVVRMFADAQAAGINLTITYGFRTMDEQVQLRQQDDCPDVYDSPAESCQTPTAKPGFSNHQMGLALDLGVDGVEMSGTDSAAYQWLSQHAADYGLHNLPSEPWHWSVDGH